MRASPPSPGVLVRRGEEPHTLERRLSTYAGGGGGKERAANLLAEQRLAPGGRAAIPLTRSTQLYER